VAEAVGDVRDQALGLAELLQDRLHGFDVRHLAVAAEIIDGARFALEKRGHDSGAMVFHVDPIAHVHAVAIDGQLVVAHGVDDHERDQFLGELIRPVIV
jgi:hypothetical protein